jgi:hypothetical protein
MDLSILTKLFHVSCRLMTIKDEPPAISDRITGFSSGYPGPERPGIL